MSALLFYLFIGAIAGFSAAFFGIGGGLIIVPALTYWFSHQPALDSYAVHLAVATSMASIVFTSASSTLAHARARNIDWRAVAWLSPMLILGSIAGVRLAVILSGRWLAIVFGTFCLLAGGQMFLQSRNSVAGSEPAGRITPWVGVLIGGISSLVGIGGGSLTVPYLNHRGYTIHRAIATAAACGLPIAITAALAYLLSSLQGLQADRVVGLIHTPALAGIVLASVISAPLGAYCVRRTAAPQVKRLFGAGLVLLGIGFIL